MYLSIVKVHRLTSSVITNAQVLPSSRSDKFVKSLRNSLCGSNRSPFSLSLCENSLLSSPLLILLFILSWICFLLFTHSLLTRFIHLQENELNSKKEFNLIQTLSVTTGEMSLIWTMLSNPSLPFFILLSSISLPLPIFGVLDLEVSVCVSIWPKYAPGTCWHWKKRIEHLPSSAVWCHTNFCA